MKIKEVAIPIALMLIVASLLVPVPAIVLDLLIVTNLLFSVGLVVLALQSTDSLKLSALPTILLLSTLFRLCINVSTSRLILSQGQGGEMVEAFGSFVLQGNIGVGVVLFLMLTLIQFIVIAKGSERVAEVAARFTLDAMPGKQMAIDADLRSGMYDMHTARLKRSELQTESRFYGALDGSMKFIKGDAIAGICIVVINIVGGLIAGMISGLSLSEAAHLYTILTVGDGLASQIPALLNSLAAGLVVTRVGQAVDTSLSTEMLEQIFQSKTVFIMAGVTSYALGVVPGMPILPLFLIGTLAISGAIFSKNKSEKKPDIVDTSFIPDAPSILEISHSISESNKISSIKSISEVIREKVFEETGIIVPNIAIKYSKDLDKLLKIKLRSVEIHSYQSETLNESCDKEFIECVVKILISSRDELIDDAHTKRWLDWNENYYPDLAAALQSNNYITTTQLTELLRNLSMERIKLEPFDRIAQGILEMAPKVGIDRALVDEIRIYLKRSIHSKLFNNKNNIKVLMVEPALESSLFLGDGEKEILDPIRVTKFIENAKNYLNQIDAILVGKSARRLLAEVCLMYQITTPVISHAEILSGISIEPVATLEEGQLYAAH
jgi:type III secretion protein V